MYNSIEAYARSVIRALDQDLDDIPFKSVDPKTKELIDIKRRRPHESTIGRIISFPQTWGSTALGFGGIAGQSITEALTVVVFGHYLEACVYFDGKLAYKINTPNSQFYEDLSNFNMSSVEKAKARYEA